METTFAIEPIEAEYPVKILGQGTEWYPCRVVGVSRDGLGFCKLICLTETDDGLLGALEVEVVRPVDE